jgi:hypothetical protein
MDTSASTEARTQRPAPPSTVQRPVAAEPAPIERHYTAGEVADLWRFNVETVRRLFENEPGVIVLQTLARKGKRPYRTIRVPQTVLDRVHKRLQIA